MAIAATPRSGCVGDSSFFLQVRRIFYLDDAGLIDSSTQSGHVPGGIVVAVAVAVAGVSRCVAKKN
jgi:hypothetical protein